MQHCKATIPSLLPPKKRTDGGGVQFYKDKKRLSFLPLVKLLFSWEREVWVTAQVRNDEKEPLLTLVCFALRSQDKWLPDPLPRVTLFS